jgi:hypothetical protein
MGKTPRLALHVRGSPAFVDYLNNLDKKSRLHRIVDEALTTLKENYAAGTQIQHALWPREYIRKYGIGNLFKLNLEGGLRLIYTILAEDSDISVIVLECLTHKEYEERFGYHVS